MAVPDWYMTHFRSLATGLFAYWLTDSWIAFFAGVVFYTAFHEQFNDYIHPRLRASMAEYIQHDSEEHMTIE